MSGVESLTNDLDFILNRGIVDLTADDIVKFSQNVVLKSANFLNIYVM